MDRSLERKDNEADEAYYQRMRQREIDVQAARREAKRVRDENTAQARAQKVSKARKIDVKEVLNEQRAADLTKEIQKLKTKVEKLLTQKQKAEQNVTQARENVEKATTQLGRSKKEQLLEAKETLQEKKATAYEDARKDLEEKEEELRLLKTPNA